jgi:hypothetical protein
MYFMAMEFIDGPTLKTEIKARRDANKPFTLQEISRIFTALCSAIDYAHSRGMVHRDIKPANVMINEEGQVVLTDFGIARIMGATQYTQTGALSGTPAYMSPEQGQGERGDERSDIYSLGVVLYELVTGMVPYDADTPFAVIMKHISEPLPLPSKVDPTIPEGVERVVLKAMSKHPEDRYTTAGEMAKALRDAVGLTADDDLRAAPLVTLATAPQVTQIEHETGPISSMKRSTVAASQKTGGATAGSTAWSSAAPDAGATTVAKPVSSPSSKSSLLPILIGGGVIILLLIVAIFALVLPSMLGPNVSATETVVAEANMVAATQTEAAQATESATANTAAQALTATAQQATSVAQQATEAARDSILATLASSGTNTPQILVVTATATETPIPSDTPVATDTPTPGPALATVASLPPPTATTIPTPAPPHRYPGTRTASPVRQIGLSGRQWLWPV